MRTARTEAHGERWVGDHALRKVRVPQGLPDKLQTTARCVAGLASMLCSALCPQGGEARAVLGSWFECLAKVGTLRMDKEVSPPLLCATALLRVPESFAAPVPVVWRRRRPRVAGARETTSARRRSAETDLRW